MNIPDSGKTESPRGPRAQRGQRGRRGRRRASGAGRFVGEGCDPAAWTQQGTRHEVFRQTGAVQRHRGLGQGQRMAAHRTGAAMVIGIRLQAVTARARAWIIGHRCKGVAVGIVRVVPVMAMVRSLFRDQRHMGPLCTRQSRLCRRLAQHHGRGSDTLPGQGRQKQPSHEATQHHGHARILASPRRPYWRAVRVFAGRAPGWLVRKGLMSSPPRRV